jgi:hypothetical protein
MEKSYVGLTDPDWYGYLSSQHDHPNNLSTKVWADPSSRSGWSREGCQCASTLRLPLLRVGRRSRLEGLSLTQGWRFRAS